MKIHVSLKEEINLSNLNNQSSLLLLSGITYSSSVLFFFFSLWISTHTHVRVYFWSIRVSRQWTIEKRRRRTKDNDGNEYEKKRVGRNYSNECMKAAPTKSLFALLLSSIFLARSNRRKKPKQKKKKEEKEKKEKAKAKKMQQKRRCRLLLFLVFFSGRRRDAMQKE